VKRYIVVFALLALAGVTWAAENSFTNYPGTLPVYGYPGPTLIVNVDNGARTLQSLYERGGGTWLGGPEGGVAPIGMFITCATTATHWTFGASTPSATAGHVLPADSSWHFINPYWMSTGKGYGAAASDNVTCQMTPEY
jgi:hypothetical protein